MNYQALIFDMDGTMVDNMSVHHRCWQEVLSRYGLHMSIAEVIATCHGRNTEIIERLFPGKYSLEECERISDEKESIYRSVFLPELKLLDGLPELLAEAHALGVPMGIGTAAPTENVDFVLDNLNLRHYFGAVVDANDVPKGKPEPDVFFRVADLLGVEYGQCLVFEDSPTGAKTALNAGMKAYILTTTHRAHEFEHIPSVLSCLNNYKTIQLAQLIRPAN